MTDFVKRLIIDTFNRDLPLWSAAVAYIALFSAFPALFFLASVLGLVAEPLELYDKLLQLISSFVPKHFFNLIAANTRDYLPNRSVPVLVFSLLLALYAGTNIFSAAIAIMNKTNRISDTRSFVRQKVIAVLFFFLFVVAAELALLVLFLIHYFLPSFLNHSSLFSSLLSYFEILFYLSSFTLVVGLFYQKGLYTKLTFREVLPGALFFTVTFLLLNIFFRNAIVYLLGRYNKTYGAISGVILLLFWLQLNALFLLMGSRIAVLIKEESQKEKQQMDER